MLAGVPIQKMNLQGCARVCVCVCGYHVILKHNFRQRYMRLQSAFPDQTLFIV